MGYSDMEANFTHEKYVNKQGGVQGGLEAEASCGHQGETDW